MRNASEIQQTLRRWSLLSKVARYSDFPKLPIFSRLLHFQAVSYDPVYMQREQFRKVFHLTNLKEGCFSSCHASGTNRKKF